MTANHCLFCQANTGPITKGVNERGEEVDVKIEGLEEHQDPVWCKSGSDSGEIVEHLKSIFIVRKVLDISAEVCEKYLQSQDGNFHPKSWFSVCSECDGLVRKCFVLERKIRHIQKELEGEKGKLKALICESERKHGGESGVELECCGSYFCNEIRQQISISGRECNNAHTSVRESGDDNGHPSALHGARRSPRTNGRSDLMRLERMKKKGIKKTSSFGRRKRKERISCDIQMRNFKVDGGGADAKSENIGDGLNISANCSVGPVPSNALVGVKTDTDGNDSMNVAKRKRKSKRKATNHRTKLVLDNKAEGDMTERDNQTPTSVVKTEDKVLSSEPETILPTCFEEKLSGEHKDDGILLEPYGEGQESDDWQGDQDDAQNKDDQSWFPTGKRKRRRKTGKTKSAQEETNSDSPGMAETSSPNKNSSKRTFRNFKVRCKKSMLEVIPERNERMFRWHTLKQTSVYSFLCPDCPARYTERLALRVHIKKAHKEMKEVGLNCPVCGWAFGERPQLEAHLQVFHKANTLEKPDPVAESSSLKLKPNPDGRLPPPNYDKSIGSLREAVFYCDHCNLAPFLRHRFLYQHMATWHGDVDLLSCQHCEKRLESKLVLKLHMRIHHSEHLTESEMNEREIEYWPAPQKCEFCEELLESKMKMDYHIHKMHPEESYRCPECGYLAPRRDKLCAHFFKEHRNIRKPKRYMCEICSHSFDTRWLLECHKRAEHHEELGLNPIKCNLCQSTFLAWQSLVNHMKVVHEKVKDKICEFCGKAFAWKCDLNKHRLLHTAPREKQYKQGPFFCEFCEAKFNVRQGLYYHMKNLHSDKYIYRCGKCGKGYAFKKTLLQHERSCKKGEEVTVKLSPSTSSGN